jgi:signal transduction histidine kinase
MVNLNTYKHHIVLTLLIIGGIFFDLSMELGVAAGVIFVIPTLYSYLIKSELSTYVATGLGIGLTVYGYIASPEGGEFWKVATNRALSVLAIAVVGFVIIIVKQQQQKLELQSRLAKAAELKSKAANSAKSRFLSAMSHELNTPLNAILGFSQLIQFEPNVPEPIQENIGYIVDAGNNLSNMINRAIDYTKAQDADIELKTAHIELLPLIEKIIDETQDISLIKEVEFDLSKIKHFPVKTMFCDQEALFKVLRILMTNAIQYNKQGGTVSISYMLNTDRTLTVNVSDTGIGIEEQDFEAVFLPFTRLSHNNAEFGGLGLGLAKAKALAELMGGEIGCYQNENEGMTFWVRLDT